MLRKYDDVSGVEMALGSGYEVVFQTEDGAMFVRHVVFFDKLFTAEAREKLFDPAGNVVSVQIRDTHHQATQPASSGGPRPVHGTFPVVDADGKRTS